MAAKGEDTEFRYPPPACCGLPARADQLLFLFLLKGKRPIEQGRVEDWALRPRPLA